ncbi:MAG: ABC transporter substrate-binding protein [Synergistaceae bacterium]|jgi:peptide/nickel transport system substrate-binding protein|nr:ABC transporter substrate-binding protein [Synergistaceae bacterium]
MVVKIFPRSFRVCAVIPAVLAALIFAFAIAPASAAELVIATPDEIQGTDVQQVTWDHVVHQLLFEPLFHLAPDLKSFAPGTASVWKMSGDNREIRFTVPQGRKFSSGAPLTAEAVKASFDRYLKISPYADDYASLDSVSVEGDDIIFSFKSSPAPAMLSLSSVYGGAVDAKDAESKGQENAKSDIESYGPMKVGEWVQGSHIRLVPNEDYLTYNTLVQNKGPVKIDAITVRFVPDNFTRTQELQAGDVDMIYNVPGERVEALKKDPNIELSSFLQSGCSLLNLNPESPGLSDIAVRRAITRAINRTELVAALSGAAEERYGLISPAMIGFSREYEDEAARLFSFDANEAARLLDEAGYKPGTDGVREKDGTRLDFTFMVAFDIPSAKKMAPVIQAQLKKIGVNANIREFERQYVNQACRDKKYDIATRSYVWGDADMLTYLFHTESEYYSYPDIDALIEAGRESPDPQERAKAYAAAERAIMGKAIAVPLVSDIDYTAYRKSVKGLILTPLKMIFVNDISKE